MARKNLIGISDSPLASEDGERPAVGRPIAGLAPTQRFNGLVGGITRSLSNITQKVERAEELERQLAEGHAIVELDPELIDSSFIIDRLGVAPRFRPCWFSRSGTTTTGSDPRAAASGGERPIPGCLRPQAACGIARDRHQGQGGHPELERRAARHFPGAGKQRPHRPLLHRASVVRNAS